jgi:hypothetical protein
MRKPFSAVNGQAQRLCHRIFANLLTEEIRPRDLPALVTELAEEGRRDGKRLTNRSINKIMQAVKAVLLELFNEGELPFNPIPKKLKLQERRVEDIHPFSDDDLENFSKPCK